MKEFLYLLVIVACSGLWTLICKAAQSDADRKTLTRRRPQVRPTIGKVPQHRSSQRSDFHEQAAGDFRRN